MAILTTGPIENNPVSGGRSSIQLTVKMSNRDLVNSSVVLIQGYTLSGTRTLYVSEAFNISPNQVITRTYFANVDGFEFVFTITGVAEKQISISTWGKGPAGELTTQHRLVGSEL